MAKHPQKRIPAKRNNRRSDYDAILAEITDVHEAGRHAAAWAVNSVMTATYWQIGRRIVEFEQGGKRRAEYGEQLLERLSGDLQTRFGRGFSIRNLRSFRAFYLAWPIRQTVSAESSKAKSSQSSLRFQKLGFAELPQAFPLPWSHYVKLLAIENHSARAFYETEALRGGWSVRQLDRQINSQFYERTMLSRNKAAMLTKGAGARPKDAVTPEEEIKAVSFWVFIAIKR